MGHSGPNWAVSPHLPSQGSRFSADTASLHWRANQTTIVLNEKCSHHNSSFSFLHLILEGEVQLSIIWEIGAICGAQRVLYLQAAYNNDKNCESHRNKTIVTNELLAVIVLPSAEVSAAFWLPGCLALQWFIVLWIGWLMYFPNCNSTPKSNNSLCSPWALRCYCPSCIILNCFGSVGLQGCL